MLSNIFFLLSFVRLFFWYQTKLVVKFRWFPKRLTWKRSIYYFFFCGASLIFWFIHKNLGAMHFFYVVIAIAICVSSLAHIISAHNVDLLKKLLFCKFFDWIYVDICLLAKYLALKTRGREREREEEERQRNNFLLSDWNIREKSRHGNVKEGVS